MHTIEKAERTIGKDTIDIDEGASKSDNNSISKDFND